MPLINPDVDSVKASGNEPLIRVQVYGPTPPVAFRMVVYGENEVPSGSDAVVITKPRPTSSLSRCVVTCSGVPPAACTVKSNVPTEVGVPLRRHVVESVIPGATSPETTDQVSAVLTDA